MPLTQEQKAMFRNLKKKGTPVKKWVGFVPSDSTGHFYTEDNLKDFYQRCQDVDEKIKMKRGNGEGEYHYGAYDIFEIKKHPSLLKEMQGWQSHDEQQQDGNY